MRRELFLIILVLGTLMFTSCEDETVTPESKVQTEYATLVVKSGPSYDNHLMAVTNPIEGQPSIQWMWDTLGSTEITFTYEVYEGNTSRPVQVSHTDTTAINWEWHNTMLELIPNETYTYYYE